MKRFILLTLAVMIAGFIKIAADVPSWVANKEKLQVSNILVEGKPIDFNGYIYAEYVPETLVPEVHFVIHNQKTGKPQYTIRIPSIYTISSKENEAGEMKWLDNEKNLVGHCVLPQIGEGMCGLLFTQEGKQIVVYFNTNKKIK